MERGLAYEIHWNAHLLCAFALGMPERPDVKQLTAYYAGSMLELWELFRQGRYEVYISDIVLSEISGCSQEKLDILLGYLKQIQYQLVHTDEDTVELAEKFIDFGILKKKSFDDCANRNTVLELFPFAVLMSL